jgi:hypothetical protein
MDAPMPSRLPLLRLPVLVLLLVLSGLLMAAGAAHAAATPAVAMAGSSFEAFAEEEGEEEGEGEGEEEETECETAEEEVAEGELTQSEADEICKEEARESKKSAPGGGATAPEECVLRSAHASAVTDADGNKLKLTVGYTTYEPTPATLDYSLVGDKGSLNIRTAKRQLGRSGVIRLTAKLAGPEMVKVEAARHFLVQLHVPGSPNSCRRFETERLSVKHASGDRTVWSQAG